MIEAAPVYWFDEIDSTSEEAKRRARRGETSPVWIAARLQTAGKGRLGRSWVSPTGNLFTTVLFPEAGGLAAAGRVPFAAALAVRDACVAAVPTLEPKLKWPNDVRVDGKKLSGILTETGDTNGVVWIALGMGLNIKQAPDGVGQEATALAEHGAQAGLQPEHVLLDLKQALQTRLDQARSDFAQLLNYWMDHAEGHGAMVQTGPVENRIEGVFEGLADDGGLILRLRDGERRTIRAGDVELVKQVN